MPQIADVNSVKQNRALGGVIEPEQQRQERGLPSASRSNDSDRLSAVDCGGNPLKDGPVAVDE